MSVQDIYNYLELTDKIGTAGQPREGQIPEIAAEGYEVVVNLALANADYSLQDERHSVEAQGMEYYHLPVIWQNPLPSNLEAFCDLMDSLKEHKVFVHCAANMRVSTFMALYRILRLGWEPEKAFQDMHCIWMPDEWWKDFIDQSLANR